MLDLKYPDNPNWQTSSREVKTIYYSDPVGNYIDGTMVLQDRKNAELKDIQTLGLIRGFTPEAYLSLVESGVIKIFEYSKADQLVRALLSKRVDAIYLNVDAAQHKTIKYQPAVVQIFFNEGLPYVEGEYRMSTMKHVAVIDQLNAFLRDNPVLKQAMMDKYRIMTIDSRQETDLSQ